MAHILNKITGAKLEAIKKQLEIDKAQHAKQGMYLKHLWVNTDNPDEIFFLFKVDDLSRCKQMVEKIYAEARTKDPHVQLPEKIYLEEEIM